MREVVMACRGSRQATIHPGAGRQSAASSSFTGIYPFVRSYQVRLIGIAKPARC